MNDIDAIKNYLSYLKKECNLSVTLHSFGSNFILKKDLIAFNIHENAFCIYVKSCPKAQKHCVLGQEKIIKKCENGAFSGVCYAGVKEYVYPINNGNAVVGFICVSGYSCKNYKEYLAKISKEYGLDLLTLEQKYSQLKSKMPEKKQVDTLIEPLRCMLELAHLKGDGVAENEDFVQRVKRFIKQRFTENITSETLMEKFNCSRSYLSHAFNQKMKMSLREYINSLRIESAKVLLGDTNLGISEIALSVGFSETAYFTEIFKKHEGVSPSAYRKKLND